MTHKVDCPALDPFAHLLGDYGTCTCGAETPAPPSSDMLLAQRMSRHAVEVGEWLNMVRGPGND
jgi:hypothetical protein